MLRTLDAIGQDPTWYENHVVSMRESHRMGLDGETVVRKIADLIERYPAWEEEWKRAEEEVDDD